MEISVTMDAADACDLITRAANEGIANEGAYKAIEKALLAAGYVIRGNGYLLTPEEAAKWDAAV